MENVETSITCKNCGNSFTGKYCNACGEKLYTEHDKSVAYIIEEAFHFLTHFEGNFFTTIKTMFLKPGKVSLDYCNGIRKKYYKPVTLFFFLIVVYLVAPSFGLNVFPKGLNMGMQEHQLTGYRNYANRQVEEKMAKYNISHEELSERFAHKSDAVSKFLLFIILPISAIVLMVLYPGKKPFFDHFILSTEINAFYLSGFFILLPLLIRGITMIILSIQRDVSFGGGESLDIAIIYTLFLSFCTVCFRRFYGSSYFVSFIKGIVYVIAHIITVFFLYKFLLFTTVMWLL